ncbi:MAG: hypothetical protein A4S09_02095 [Proteobacteria bacterium SG_bin7]|nr:MAG: hypothetical protein A4S09_02095 [Proteobacteria bacterium SG_bin7]
MKKLLISGIVALSTQNSFAVQEDGMLWKPENAILVVLDVSGSMAGAMLDSVRGEMDRAFSPQAFPANGMAGLISFSGCSPSDVRLEVPLAKGAGPQVLARAHALQATGSTDIYSALVLAKNEALKLGKNKCTKVMILTDGADTCSIGDVVGISADIAKINECNQVNTVALGTGVNIEQTLKDISKAGQGEHRTVSDLFDLEENFNQTLENLNSRSQVVTGMRDWQGEDKGPNKKKNKKGHDDPDKTEGDNGSDGPHDPNTNANQQSKTRKN